MAKKRKSKGDPETTINYAPITYDEVMRNEIVKKSKKKLPRTELTNSEIKALTSEFDVESWNADDGDFTKDLQVQKDNPTIEN